MRLGILAAAAAVLVIAGACSDERSITYNHVGDLGYGILLAKQSTNLPRGRIVVPNVPIASATPAGDSILVELAGLDSLTTGSYAVWVSNDSATKFALLSGTLTIAKVDTTINAAGDPVFTPSTATIPNVTTFRNGGQNYYMRLSSSRARATGLAATDSANMIIVSIETGTPGAAPSATRPLWARRSTTAADTVRIGTTAVGTTFRLGGFKFGNFAPRVADEYVYATSTFVRTLPLSASNVAATTNNAPRGRVEVRGPVFTVNDSNYYRPPKGYFYQAWAIRSDTLGRWIDTLSLGVKASPYPNRISFLNADTEIPDPTAMFGTPVPVIFASQHRVSADTLPAANAVAGGRPWNGFAFSYVTLQSKFAPTDRMGAVAVMTAGLPGSILGR